MKSVLSLVSLVALTGTLAGALALGDDGKKETAAAPSRYHGKEGAKPCPTCAAAQPNRAQTMARTRVCS